MNRPAQGPLFSSPLAACLLLALGAGVAAAGEPATLQLLQTIPLKGAAGRLDHMAIDGKHARLFVANLSNNSLDIVDLKAGKIVKQVLDQKRSRASPTPPTWIGSTSAMAVAANAISSTGRNTSSSSQSSCPVPTTCVTWPAAG
jgi:hypothetical protein